MTYQQEVTYAPAKINWILDVLDKRADGFHELETVVSSIDLADEIIFRHGESITGVKLQCSDSTLATDKHNLVYRAIDLMARRAGIVPNIQVQLNKRIPAGGGLGGGSSDAASTLRVLNRLWNLNWPIKRLIPMAAELGSDVPILLLGGSVIARGRGEFVEPIQLKWHGHIVLAMPAIHTPTHLVYSNVRAEDRRQICSAEEDFCRPTELPFDAEQLMKRCRNGLENPAFRSFPELARLHECLQELSGRQWRLCGSGSSLYTAYDSSQDAEWCASEIRSKLGIRADVTRIRKCETP